METVTLDKDEAKAVYEVIDQLSGGNAGNAFAWDGTDDPSDPLHRALAKIFRLAGKNVPDNLKTTGD